MTRDNKFLCVGHSGSDTKKYEKFFEGRELDIVGITKKLKEIRDEKPKDKWLKEEYSS